MSLFPNGKICAVQGCVKTTLVRTKRREVPTDVGEKRKPKRSIAALLVQEKNRQEFCSNFSLGTLKWKEEEPRHQGGPTKCLCLEDVGVAQRKHVVHS